MAEFKLKKGYEIKIAGKSELTLNELPEPDLVALQPNEFRGIKARLMVEAGDDVKIGTVLFADKANPDLKFVSPVSGKVAQINRGERRMLLEVVIENDHKNTPEAFEKWTASDVKKLSREQVVAHLLNSGMWPYLRQRPFNKIANHRDTPRDIFVSAMDTAPLAADPSFLLQGEEEHFQVGLDLLGKLTDGKVYLSLDGRKKSQIPAFEKAAGVEKNTFSGPHPAGNVGVHIHHIKPIRSGDVIWYVQPYIVALIGKLFTTGVFPSERIVATAGSSIDKRSYYKTILGAPVTALVPEGSVVDKEVRFLLGNVLTGRKISPAGYVGFYDNLITVIPEGDKKRRLMGWFFPGSDMLSYSKSFLSSWLPSKEFVLDTKVFGGKRAFIQSGDYEKFLPMDILPVHLAKSIMAEDFVEMEGLGILECDEEDLALCSYICPSKTDFGEILRKGLDFMEREG
ncbi:MAG: Na(+)-translocating NADH-quinone reductase subunit A [Calditrichaceae bacterium]